MYVVVPCEYGKDLIENSGDNAWTTFSTYKKVQVGKDQEKAQSEKDSLSKNRGGKKPN